MPSPQRAQTKTLGMPGLQVIELEPPPGCEDSIRDSPGQQIEQMSLASSESPSGVQSPAVPPY
jgi:hypothetical protein